MHVDALGVSAYVPAIQDVQLDWPMVLEYVPAIHGMQLFNIIPAGVFDD